MNIEEIDEKLCDIIELMVGKMMEQYGSAKTRTAVYEALSGNFASLSQAKPSAQDELIGLLKESITSLSMADNNANAFCRAFRKTYLKRDSERRNDALWDARIDLYNPNKFQPNELGFMIDAINEDYREKYGVRDPLDGISKDIGNTVAEIIETSNAAQAANTPLEWYLEDGDMHLGDMQASTNIGKEKPNQEDAVLLMQHSSNPEFRLLVVADGVGGEKDGEKASGHTINSIAKWFDTLDPSFYARSEELSEMLRKKLCDISDELSEKYAGPSTTFVGAIVCDKHTVVANVGDSRAYKYDGKENSIEQVSTDHTPFEEYARTKNQNLQYFQVEKRDDVRFHRKSNLASQWLGSGAKPNPSILTIPNDYDVLILVSDGVSDCMSEKDIIAITEQTPRDEIAKKLVEFALENNSEIRQALKGNPNYNESVKGGKDNTTAAVYIPKRPKHDEIDK